MVDTIRTPAQILALFADNTTGDISPQDLRDFVVSTGVFGLIYVSDGSTPQSVSSTPAKVTAFDTNSSLASGITEDQANARLTLGTNADGTFVVFAPISFSGTANKVATFEIYKGGIATGFKATRTISSGGSVGSTVVFGLVSASAGDNLELYVSTATDGNSITVTQAALFAARFG